MHEDTEPLVEHFLTTVMQALSADRAPDPDRLTCALCDPATRRDGYHGALVADTPEFIAGHHMPNRARCTASTCRVPELGRGV